LIWKKSCGTVAANPRPNVDHAAGLRQNRLKETRAALRPCASWIFHVRHRVE
jgi:hypothetical protein